VLADWGFTDAEITELGRSNAVVQLEPANL
jgi:hypothetical protein